MSTDDPIIVADRPGALANYPHARRVGGFVFVSGISCRQPDDSHVGVTVDADGTIHRDVAVQTRAVIDNLSAILNAADASLDDLVDLTVFLIDMDDYAAFNAVYNEYFDAQRGPARTTVAVAELPHPNLAIEIKAVAHTEPVSETTP